MESTARPISTTPWPTTQAPASTHTTVSMEQLAKDYRGFITDIEHALKSVSTLSGEGVGVLRTKLEDTLANAKGRMSQASAVALDSARHGRAKTEEYMKQRPWTALGLAAAVGTVIGVLIARR